MWCFTSTCLVRLLLKRLVAILIAPSLSSLITMLSSIGGVKKLFTCQRKRSSFTTSASATYSDSDDAAAVTFYTLENQPIAPPPTSPLRLTPNAECLGKRRSRRPPMPTGLCTIPAFLRRGSQRPSCATDIVVPFSPPPSVMVPGCR